jgi:hypothetical protein
MEKESVRISVIERESSRSSQDETPLVYLSDIVCSPADNPGDDPIRRTIRTLELKRSGLESEKRLWDTEAEVMVSYARSLTSQHASLTDIDDFLSTFGGRGWKNINTVRYYVIFLTVGLIDKLTGIENTRTDDRNR